jgi:exoribonuclease R
MNTIALNLRKKRIEGGSLIFETPKKSFTLNENHFPVAYEIKNRC